MSTITQQTTAVTGATITADVWNDEFENIIDDYNGSISNANIAADAGIALTKISNTAVSLTDTQTLTNKTLTGPTITSAIQTLKADSDASTVTFDLDAGSIHTVTLGGNRTLALSNADAGKVFIIRLIQDGTGSRTVTWFSTIDWIGGTAPTLTTTAAAIDVFGFICTASNVYDGFIVGQALS